MTPAQRDTQLASPMVLCIAGSPRRKGNTDALLDALAEGVVEAGGSPVRLIASESGAAPCRGCNACSSTGECVVHDRMDEVYHLLDTADAIVVSTPVYFATVPAVLKVIYDRCQPYWAQRYVLGEEIERRRPGALLLVGGGGDPFGTECVVAPTRSVFAVLGIDLIETEQLVGADSPSDVGRHPESLARAREIGVRLTRSAAAP